MIYHYINLSAWEVFPDMYKADRDLYYCDSVSLYLLARVFGFSPVLNPGPLVLRRVIERSKCSKSLFLTSGDDLQVYFLNSYVLMYYSDDVFVDHSLMSALGDLLPDDIYIGISSPKQNILAAKIHDDFRFVDIYCIGAALSVNSLIRPSSFLLKSGFQWLEFLACQPKRTVKKLISTFFSICRILFSKKSQVKFKKLCSQLVVN